MTRSTSFVSPRAAVVLLATLMLACGDNGPTEPAGRTPGAYSLRDISDDISGPPTRFNDKGDLVVYWRQFVSGGVTPAPPAPCGAVTLNNRSHVLCSSGTSSDGRGRVSDYGIWDGETLRPLASADTFPAGFFTAWAMNDSDEVVGTFANPTFTNPACEQWGCGVIWRDGQPTVLSGDAYMTTQMNNRRDLLGRTQDWYSVSVWFYEATTGKSRNFGDSNTTARDMNDQGWVVGTLYGNRWNHRNVAFVSRPEGLTELGTGDANGVNNAGEIVGVLDSVAVIWRGDVPSPLTFAASDTNWTVTRATLINNHGQIVAQADDSTHGRFNRWVVLTPIAR